ncbi:MAG: ketoacyl-ACP synthase III [Deltaproteobacteria bacterium]|nr:ketoacyl-ACP synthase III [Deltaproteobacteria bacterium]
MRGIITATAHYVPDKRLTNKDLEKMVDTNDEWITTRTGIKERRILDQDKGASYMANRVAEKLIEKRGISADEIDLIILATATPDMYVPSASALVQNNIKANNCWAFDINAGCSGFIYALITASKFIAAGKEKKIIIIGVEKLSAYVDYEDRNLCVLFGDGAGGVLLEPGEDDQYGIQDYILRTDGKGAQYLNLKAGGSIMPASIATVSNKLHYLYQDGKIVFKFAVKGITDTFLRLIKQNGLIADDIDLFIPHQANYRIISAVGEKIGLPAEKIMVNVQKYGNTSAATIPIAMSEAYDEKRIKKGDKIVLSAFGAGFTWGSVLLNWAK